MDFNNAGPTPIPPKWSAAEERKAQRTPEFQAQQIAELSRKLKTLERIVAAQDQEAQNHKHLQTTINTLKNQLMDKCDFYNKAVKRIELLEKKKDLTEMGTETEIVQTAERGVGTENIKSNDMGEVTGIDTGTGTEEIFTEERGTGTEEIFTEERGTGTETEEVEETKTGTALEEMELESGAGTGPEDVVLETRYTDQVEARTGAKEAKRPRTNTKNNKINKRHGNYKPKDDVVIQCSLCDKTFTKRYATASLKRHMNTDHEERRIECRICKKTFTRTEGLKLHMQLPRVHQKFENGPTITQP